MDAEAPKSGNQAGGTKASELIDNAKTTAETVRVKVVGAAEGATDATKTKLQPSSGEPVESAPEKKKDHPSACLPADHKDKEDDNSADGGGDGLMDKAKGLFTK